MVATPVPALDSIPAPAGADKRCFYTFGSPDKSWTASRFLDRQQETDSVPVVAQPEPLPAASTGVSHSEVEWLREQLSECREALQQFENSETTTPRDVLRQEAASWRRRACELQECAGCLLIHQCSCAHSYDCRGEVEKLKKTLQSALVAVNKVSCGDSYGVALKQQTEEVDKLRSQVARYCLQWQRWYCVDVVVGLSAINWN